MSRALGSLVRPLTVWLLVSAAAATTVTSVPAAWDAARSHAGSDAVAGLVVAVCATGLALALTWLWLVTTTTVLGLLRGRVTARGATRRLVLVACGVAVVAGTGAPALATGGDARELLAGLSLPERAVAPIQHHATRNGSAPDAPADTYVVRPGDSLSSIALAHPRDGSLEDRWRAIWRANRDVVGDDPDLILPGQALRLPDTTPTTPPTSSQDGDQS